MDIEARLKHIEQVRFFGEELGIDFKGILSDYDSSTKHQNLYYLIVTPPNSLEAYVEEEVIGRSKKKLVKLEREYKEKGYDTMLDQATGWEDCQITKTLLRENYLIITDTVLHEGWHQTTNLTDNNLDESIALAVGYFGTTEYCKLYDNKNFGKAKIKLEESMKIASYVIKYYKRLKKAYKQPNWIELKPKIIGEAKEEKRELRKNCIVHSGADFVSDSKINNSYFYSEYMYYQHFNLVSKVFKKLGLEESIKFLKRYEDHENCIKNMREMTSKK